MLIKSVSGIISIIRPSVRGEGVGISAVIRAIGSATVNSAPTPVLASAMIQVSQRSLSGSVEVIR